MAVELVIQTSALKTLANIFRSVFIRQTVAYEKYWNPTVDSRGQVLIRSGSKSARRVCVEPINIKSAKLQSSGRVRMVGHGEELLVIVEQDIRVAGVAIYWVKWSERPAKRFKSEVRVIYPPQFF